MFQAPRPISHAPSITAFTPSAAPVQQPSSSSSSSSHQPHHVAAVPMNMPSSRGPIAVHLGSRGVPGLSASQRPTHLGPTYARTMPISPSSSGNGGAASAGAAPIAPRAVPAAVHTGGGSSGGGSGSGSVFAAGGMFGAAPVSTPSPEPFYSFVQPQVVSHVDLYVPQSPMVSPMITPGMPYASTVGGSGGAPGGDVYAAAAATNGGGSGSGSGNTSGATTPGGSAVPSATTGTVGATQAYRPRRDSADETEVANAHLHTILWRNANASTQAQRGASTLRHTPLHVTAVSTGGASPKRQGTSASAGPMMSPKPSAAQLLQQQESPSTPTPASPALVGANGTRAIPIAGASRPKLAPSVLASLQQADEAAGAAGGGVVSTSASNNSRALPSAGTSLNSSVAFGGGSGSFVSSSSPLATSGSLSSSYTILSHTPPTRSGNPQEHDCCFSPAQQAAYFKQLQSTSAGVEGGTSIPSLLPMMHAMQSNPNTLRPSSLSSSLAQRQQMQNMQMMSQSPQTSHSAYSRGGSSGGGMMHNKFGSPQQPGYGYTTLQAPHHHLNQQQQQMQQQQHTHHLQSPQQLLQQPQQPVSADEERAIAAPNSCPC